MCPGGACAPSCRDWVLEKRHRETTVPRGMAPPLVINGVLFPRGPRVVMPRPGVHDRRALLSKTLPGFCFLQSDSPMGRKSQLKPLSQVTPPSAAAQGRWPGRWHGPGPPSEAYGVQGWGSTLRPGVSSLAPASQMGHGGW